MPGHVAYNPMTSLLGQSGAQPPPPPASTVAGSLPDPVTQSTVASSPPPNGDLQSSTVAGSVPDTVSQSWHGSPPPPPASTVAGSVPDTVAYNGAPTGTQQGVMTTPGANENWWAQNGQQFGGPSQASQYWAGQQGAMQGGTNSQSLYNNGPANMDAYFNDAQKTASTQLDNSLAARGVYDSGAGIDQQRMLDSNLAGQKAMAQAGYMSGLAGQADTQNQGAWRTGGSLAQAGDQMDLSKLLGGSQASNTAQNNMSGRERGNLQDMMSYANMLGGNYQGNVNQGLQQNADMGQQIADMGSQIGGFDSKNYADQRNRLMQLLGLGATALGGGKGA